MWEFVVGIGAAFGDVEGIFPQFPQHFVGIINTAAKSHSRGTGKQCLGVPLQFGARVWGALIPVEETAVAGLDEKLDVKHRVLVFFKS